MPRGKRLIPKGAHWVGQVFDKPILDEPRGVVVRKSSSVERNASEALLLSMAKARGFRITRFGTHYIIHRKSTRPILIS